jgi:hypothetical protein
MPVAEFRALLRADVPPHGNGCFSMERHGYLFDPVSDFSTNICYRMIFKIPVDL